MSDPAQPAVTSPPQRAGSDPAQPNSAGASYAAAGVDIAAGERAVELMRASVARATRPEVIGGLGGFAGLFRADFSGYQRPILATSTDGVGTKVAVAQLLDRHDTIGFDLVGMVVDDLVVCGAEPLFMTDYIATGRLVPERVAAIVDGIARACEVAGAALIGGETAEHPGLLGPDEYDLAGAATGVVDEPDLLGPHRVRPGDVIIALGSSGLHSNGYSLAREVFLGRAGWDLNRQVAELGRTLGEELLEPTRIYAKDCLALATELDVHAIAHITGGGLAANVARVLPDHLDARLDRSTWRPQPVFDLVGELGAITPAELEGTFNMGVGMVVILNAAHADRALRRLSDRAVRAWVLGSVEPGTGAARLGSSHSG
ncbi:MAG TPA: phosphoribosylformylglycinamidine cyclo-ligase [Actinomycetes bacterium]|nr:phosphoribosylformylglycinamidine cyclo-ligase [Actinomycetes bacterium]